MPHDDMQAAKPRGFEPITTAFQRLDDEKPLQAKINNKLDHDESDHDKLDHDKLDQAEQVRPRPTFPCGHHKPSRETRICMPNHKHACRLVFLSCARRHRPATPRNVCPTCRPSSHRPRRAMR